MNIDHHPYTALWYEDASDRVLYIDQARLPWNLVINEIRTFNDGIRAINDMEVRGAPLIGVTAAFTFYVGKKEGLSPASMANALISTRPTAVNLAYVVDQMLRITDSCHPSIYLLKALEIRNIEIATCQSIGEQGLLFIRQLAEHNDHNNHKAGKPVNILTHCNAGWLATVDYGTALAPVYRAFDEGIPVHVWVDETRPRNQGARLTVYELTGHGVPNTLIVDNAGGLLMQRGQVDLVLVGADRITANGDVINKVGTYLKALAAFDNRIPFYVAAPKSTFDNTILSGNAVPIEERSENEVLFVDDQHHPIAPEGTKVQNPGFDITPSRLVTGYLTGSIPA